MSLLKRFKPVSGSLLTAEQTGLPEIAVRSANRAVKNMPEKEPKQCTYNVQLLYNKRTTYAYNFYRRGSYHGWQIRCQEWSGKGAETLQDPFLDFTLCQQLLQQVFV